MHSADPGRPRPEENCAQTAACFSTTVVSTISAGSYSHRAKAPAAIAPTIGASQNSQS
jgi:hypothetical protein